MKSQKSHKPNDLNLDFDTLPLGIEWRVETLTFSLSLEMEDPSLEKAMGTLTPKGIFIGFPTKWLELIKGMSHLI